MRRRGHRRAIHLLAAAAFASAVLCDALGAHQCGHHAAMYGGAQAGEQHDDAPGHGPHHGPRGDTDPAGSAPGFPSVDGDHDGAALHAAWSGTDSHTEHGPCTCVGTCHGGSATPLPGFDTAPVRVAQGVRQAWVVPAATRLPGARQNLYILPLPNAPPVAG